MGRRKTPGLTNRGGVWHIDKKIRGHRLCESTGEHNLEEAEELCRNIAIIDHGKIVQNTDMKSLLGTLDIETFVLDLQEPLSVVPQVEGMEFKLRDPFTLEASLPKRKSLNTLFSSLDSGGVRVQSMRNKANRLEELFLRMVDKGTTT